MEAAGSLAVVTLRQGVSAPCLPEGPESANGRYNGDPASSRVEVIMYYQIITLSTLNLHVICH